MAPTVYTVDVRVKPYVKQYLINNCGNPVDLSKMPKLNNLFRRLIYKPVLRFESLPLPNSDCYVSIIISQDLFYRNGWEMTRNNQMLFNSEVENEIKFIMRNYVATFSTFYNIATCIRMFQDRFKLPEDMWGYDAIKKDLDRNSEVKKSKEIEEFVRKMDRSLHKLFVENLSTVGTISNKMKNELNQVYR
jgi:hypothetical protein